MDPRRSIPSVERLLANAAFADLLSRTPRTLVVTAIQRMLEEVRLDPSEHDAVWYAERVAADLDALRTSTLIGTINATGVVLHTNLGRAPLADAAIAAIQRAASGYTTLEYDLGAGHRGSRYDHCARLLRELTGAGDALVVNNNAAALVLALNTFARGKHAIVSRGELVEIGGSFRVPEIMARSGARLTEVGSTNRTHAHDYSDAIGPRTGALLKVHRSNFLQAGYVAEVSTDELVGIAATAGVPFLYDLGSGLLDHAASLGMANEPTARDAIASGATVVTVSGDKLLGGPQSGILLGSPDIIARLRRNPLCRALRVDKVTLAALEATLILHLDPERARHEIPTLRMLTMTVSEIERRAACFVDRLRGEGIGAGAGIDVSIADGHSAVGGGASPGTQLATMLVRVRPRGLSAAAFERRLRTQRPPVVARIENDAVLVDLRTVSVTEEAALLAALVGAASRQPGGDA